MKENFLTCYTALVLYLHHQQTMMEVGLGNCKTEVPHAKVLNMTSCTDGKVVSLMQTTLQDVTHALASLLKYPDGEFKELK